MSSLSRIFCYKTLIKAKFKPKLANLSTDIIPSKNLLRNENLEYFSILGNYPDKIESLNALVALRKSVDSVIISDKHLAKLI